jgi:hypothetical protein
VNSNQTLDSIYLIKDFKVSKQVRNIGMFENLNKSKNKKHEMSRKSGEIELDNRLNI